MKKQGPEPKPPNAQNSEPLSLKFINGVKSCVPPPWLRKNVGKDACMAIVEKLEQEEEERAMENRE
jgi:hypothetical protein